LIFLEEKKTGRKFAFLNSLRIAILSILLFVLIFLAIWVERPFSYLPLIIAFGIALVLGIANFKLFKWFNYRLVLYFQSFVDITLITITVYYTGGITSPFYFLYILPIFISAIFLTRRDTIYIATFSYIVFVVLSDLIYLEIIAYYPLVPSIDITLNVFIYNSVMSFIAFSGIGILSSYYFDRMRKTGAELRNARENLKDLVLLNNTVLERMENGFIICDTHGIVISFNEKSKALLKLNNRSNIFNLLHMTGGDTPDSPPLNKKNYFEQEIENRVLGVSYSIIENIYSFDRVYVFIITDLTEKREIENKLKQKEHFALIGEMSAGIAHEIRNPLASISGSVQFLSKELKLETEYQHLMDIIVKESSRLSNSIEGFLDYARMTPLKETSFDLSHLINDVTHLVSLNHPEVKIIKKYSEGNTIYADAKKINQVVWNLINNSMKALNNKGTIEINIYRNENGLYLSIKDNGIGIESGKLEKIFVPFHSNFTSGIGLGMSIVKRIIDEHNFDIRINSEKNIGTEVIICFNKN
jgi:two-component system sensor histidine kinase PilS (NtrC family)